MGNSRKYSVVFENLMRNKINHFARTYTFTRSKRVHVSTSSTPHNQIGTDKMSSVGLSPGSVMSSLHPTIVISLAHGEGPATSCSSAVVVTITETPTSEAPDVSTPVVNIVLNTS